MSSSSLRDGGLFIRGYVLRLLPAKAWAAWETGIPVGYGDRRAISGLKKAAGLWPQRTANKNENVSVKSNGVKRSPPQRECAEGEIKHY